MAEDELKNEKKEADISSGAEEKARSPMSGYLMRYLGGAGVIVNLALAILLPLMLLRAAPGIAESLETTSETLQTLSTTLEVTSRGIATASQSLNTTATVVGEVEGNLSTIEPLLESIGSLIGQEAPDMIEGTYQALLSAGQTASTIDRVLRGLAALGPITGVSYDPERSLADGVTEAANSLAPLPNALRGVESDLGQAVAGLDPLTESTLALESDLEVLAADLDTMATALERQAADLEDLASRLQNVADQIGLWATAGSLLFLFFFLWFALSQYAVYTLGTERLRLAGGGD